MQCLSTKYPYLPFQIYNINPEMSSISFIYYLDFEWNDINLKFHNLKNDDLNNSINNDYAQNKIWIPKLKFTTLSGILQDPKLLNSDINIREAFQKVECNIQSMSQCVSLNIIEAKLININQKEGTASCSSRVSQKNAS